MSSSSEASSEGESSVEARLVQRRGSGRISAAGAQSPDGHWGLSGRCSDRGPAGLQTEGVSGGAGRCGRRPRPLFQRNPPDVWAELTATSCPWACPWLPAGCARAPPLPAPWQPCLLCFCSVDHGRLGLRDQGILAGVPLGMHQSATQLCGAGHPA